MNKIRFIEKNELYSKNEKVVGYSYAVIEKTTTDKAVSETIIIEYITDLNNVILDQHTPKGEK